MVGPGQSQTGGVLSREAVKQTRKNNITYTKNSYGTLQSSYESLHICGISHLKHTSNYVLCCTVMYRDTVQQYRSVRLQNVSCLRHPLHPRGEAKVQKTFFCKAMFFELQRCLDVSKTHKGSRALPEFGCLTLKEIVRKQVINFFRIQSIAMVCNASKHSQVHNNIAKNTGISHLLSKVLKGTWKNEEILTIQKATDLSLISSFFRWCILVGSFTDHFDHEIIMTFSFKKTNYRIVEVKSSDGSVESFLFLSVFFPNSRCTCFFHISGPQSLSGLRPKSGQSRSHRSRQN